MLTFSFFFKFVCDMRGSCSKYWWPSLALCLSVTCASVLASNGNDLEYRNLLDIADQLKLKVKWDENGDPILPSQSDSTPAPTPTPSPRVRLVFNASDSPFLLRANSMKSDRSNDSEGGGVPVKDDATAEDRGGVNDDGEEEDGNGNDSDKENGGGDDEDGPLPGTPSLDQMPSPRTHDDVAALLGGTVRLFWPNRSFTVRCYCFDCERNTAFNFSCKSIQFILSVDSISAVSFECSLTMTH